APVEAPSANGTPSMRAPAPTESQAPIASDRPATTAPRPLALATATPESAPESTTASATPAPPPSSSAPQAPPDGSATRNAAPGRASPADDELLPSLGANEHRDPDGSLAGLSAALAAARVA